MRSCIRNCFLILPLLLAGTGLALGAQTSPASQGHFGFTMYTGASFGGDEIAKLYFTDGSTQSVNAGQGLEFGVGCHYKLPALPVDLSATVGYKSVTTAAKNADIHLDRTVLELRADYLINRTWWIGAGPVWHKSINFDAGGLAPNIGFQDASGATVKVGWRWFALSYVNMKYTDEFGGKYDASNLGLSVIGKW